MSLNFEQLGLNILLATIFSVLGFVLLFVGYRMFDAVTPGNLSRRIFDEGNVAAAIMAGATGMKWREFLLAAGSGNLAIALVWSVAGAMGRQADSLQWMLVGSLVVPVMITWFMLRRNMQTPSREL